jgi:hypothetical protein
VAGLEPVWLGGRRKLIRVGAVALVVDVAIVE